MTSTILNDDDISLEALEGRRIAVIGYGSQGRAHALNLADSGLDVVVGLREGFPSWERAEADGMSVTGAAAAAGGAQIISLLVPDQHMPAIYEQSIAPSIGDGAALVFAHGFNIHYELITPPATVDVLLVGPKAPGKQLRRLFEQGKGAPAVFAVHKDDSGAGRARALAYAKGIGSGRAGLLETTFAEETETDLFGEQAVLAGAVAAILQAGFETMVDAGYQPEVAYLECQELRLVVDLAYRGGLTGLTSSISETAQYGSLTRGPMVIGDEVKQTMRRVLDDIRSGMFAREWIEESKAGAPSLEQKKREQSEQQMEEVGAILREIMPVDE